MKNDEFIIKIDAIIEALQTEDLKLKLAGEKFE